MKYKVGGLNELSKQFHQFQMDAGFTDANVTQRLMLVHSEISEAFEAFRKDHYAKLESFEEWINKLTPSTHPAFSADVYKDMFELQIKDSFEDELADSVIRLLAICAENNIDIEKHIELKMRYNELRGFKYGGKKF